MTKILDEKERVETLALARLVASAIHSGSRTDDESELSWLRRASQRVAVGSENITVTAYLILDKWYPESSGVEDPVMKAVELAREIEQARR